MKVTYEGAAIELRDARKQWTDTKIIAPFGGIITSKKAELGAYVSAGTSIAEMANVARLRVSLAVSESNVYKLHKGQKVGVSADVYPGVIYKGAISGISPQGSDSHTYPIEISIANNGRKQLKAGTYVNIHVDMGETKRALMIPRDAIVSSVKDPSVYVVRGGTAHIVRINTGDDSGSYFEVTSGIKEGDLVVINGQINLIDGCRVSVVKN
jgi:RND family efflux transporter MFP subunit